MDSDRSDLAFYERIRQRSHCDITNVITSLRVFDIPQRAYQRWSPCHFLGAVSSRAMGKGNEMGLVIGALGLSNAISHIVAVRPYSKLDLLDRPAIHSRLHHPAEQRDHGTSFRGRGRVI
jgi:hypothetical protein